MQTTVPVVDMGHFPWGIVLMAGIVAILVMVVRMLLK